MKKLLVVLISITLTIILLACSDNNLDVNAVDEEDVNRLEEFKINPLFSNSERDQVSEKEEYTVTVTHMQILTNYSHGGNTAIKYIYNPTIVTEYGDMFHIDLELYGSLSEGDTITFDRYIDGSGDVIKDNIRKVEVIE